MAGPWEKYQAQPSAAPVVQSPPVGPWAKYGGQSASQSQPALPPPATYSQREIGGRMGVKKRTIETEQYDPSLSDSGGVHPSVRMHVGSAPAPDRLANLQRFHPEAQPYGQDNFIFVNPKTQKWELYNPEGLDAGDLPSVAREAVVGTAATLGGIAGAFTGPGAPVAVPAGAGAAGVAAGSLFDTLEEAQGRIDTRTIPERAIDAGYEFVSNAGAEVIGPMIANVPKGMVQGVKSGLGGGDEAAQRLAAAKAAGVQNPTAGMMSTSRAVHGAESTLSSLPGSADVMQNSSQRAIDQMDQAAEGLASRYGGGSVTKAQENIGETLQTGATQGADRMKKQYGQLYETAYNMAGRDLPIDVSALKTLRDEFATTLSQAEGSLKPSYGAAISEIDTILKDAAKNGGVLPLEVARRINTKIGRELDRPVLTSESPGGLEDLRKATYGKLKEAIDTGVAASNPQAGRVLRQANKMTEAYKRLREPFLKQVAAAKTPEQAFNIAMSGAKDGGTRLMKLRKSYTPEQWDAISGHVLYSLGRAKPNAQSAAGDVFSPSTFLTKWNTLSPGAKNALFSGQRYKNLRPALDNLAGVIEGAKQVEKQANSSGTARAAAYSILFSSVLAAPVSKTAAAIVATPVVSAYATAKLMTSTKFVNWLASSLKDTSFQAKPLGVMTQLTRLTQMVASEESEVRDAVQKYVDAVKAQVQGSQAP